MVGVGEVGVGRGGLADCDQFDCTSLVDHLPCAMYKYDNSEVVHDW